MIPSLGKKKEAGKYDNGVNPTDWDLLEVNQKDNVKDALGTDSGTTKTKRHAKKQVRNAKREARHTKNNVKRDVKNATDNK